MEPHDDRDVLLQVHKHADIMALTFFVAPLCCFQCGVSLPADTSTDMQNHLSEEPWTVYGIGDLIPDSTEDLACAFTSVHPRSNHETRILQSWVCPSCGLPVGGDPDFINPQFDLDGDRFSLLVWFREGLSESEAEALALPASLSKCTPESIAMVPGCGRWYRRRAWFCDSDSFVRLHVRTAYNPGIRNLRVQPDYLEKIWAWRERDELLRKEAMRVGLDESLAREIVQLDGAVLEIGADGYFEMGPEFSPTPEELTCFRKDLAGWIATIHKRHPFALCAVRTSNAAPETAAIYSGVGERVAALIEEFVSDAESDPSVLAPQLDTRPSPEADQLLQAIFGKSDHVPARPFIPAGDILLMVHDWAIHQRLWIDPPLRQRMLEVSSRLYQLVDAGHHKTVLSYWEELKNALAS